MDAAIALAENVHSIGFADLPEKTVAVTKRSILDTLGVMLAATSLGEGCPEMVTIARGAGGTQESTILAYGDRVPAPMAAFANGAMTHPLDYDDTHDSATVHPTAVTLPAALALAERRGGVSGKDFITAIALGNDLVSRLGLALNRGMSYYGWLLPPVLGVFGAAAAAGKVVGLDRDGIINALGLALNRAAGSLEVLHGTGSTFRAIRDAFTGQDAVLCVLMAQQGLSGVRTSLEGSAGLFNLYFKGDYDRQKILSGLGERFEGTYVSFKPWASCRLSHPFVDAAMSLVQEHDIRPEQVKEIRLVVGKLGRNLCEPAEERQAPSLAIDAKFSLPFNLGLVVAQRKVTLADFTPEGLKNPLALELARKVTYDYNPEFDGVGIEPGTVKINCGDSRVYSRHVRYAYGHPENPISQEDLETKFRECASYSVTPRPEAAVTAAIEMVRKLEEVSDVSQLARLLS